MMYLLLSFAAALTTPGYDRCVAAIDRAGFVTSQMLACATREMDRADAALNDRYKNKMARLHNPERLRLRDRERAWVAMRRSRCLAAARDPIPSSEINRMLCLVRATDARTDDLARVR